MTVDDRSRIIVVGSPSADVLRSVGHGGDDDVEWEPDVERALSTVTADADSDDRVALVAITAEHAQPLSAARRFRDVDSLIGLAFVVSEERSAPMRTKLQLVPEVAGAVVIPADGSPQQLHARLRTAADAAGRRWQLRTTLDGINRDLLTRSTPVDEPDPPPTVSERYLAALTRHLPEAILALDADGRVVTLNDSAVRMLQVPLGSAEGRPFTDLVRTDAADDLGGLLTAAARGETDHRHDVRVLLADQTDLLVTLTAAPIPDEAGRIAGLVVVVRDVTASRRSEQRLREFQKVESLATLAGGVAHDFNNLLVTVSSWAELAAEDVSDTEMVSTALGHIHTAARRAAELARSMLVYGGRGQIELEPVDVNDLVADMSGLLQASVSRKTAIEIQLAETLAEVVADPSQLRQVLLNLVTNADEAIGDQVGTVRIRTGLRHLSAPATESDGVVSTGTRGLPPATYVELEVTDSGPGMDAGTMARIFDPFYTTKFAGRGLGLAAASGIVRAHGGAITAQSRPGHGTTFHVLIPTATEEPS